MPDAVFLLATAIVAVVILLLVLSYFSKKKAPVVEAVEQRHRGVPVLRGDDVEAPRRNRNVRARMRFAAARQEGEQEEEDEDLLADDIGMANAKIGAKKLRKLEMKAEKRKERERELEEREGKKQRELEREEKRKEKELLEKELEQKQEEAEKLLIEEQKKKEHEEYLKLKETFSIEEEGFDQDDTEEHRFQEFIEYIKTQKIVLLEDLGSRFKLKTQDAIDRVQNLLAQETLTGVIDDRGKFVYITKDELEAVAQFIRQRGRVSITELVECSNTLINLDPVSEMASVAS